MLPTILSHPRRGGVQSRRAVPQMAEPSFFGSVPKGRAVGHPA